MLNPRLSSMSAAFALAASAYAGPSVTANEPGNDLAEGEARAPAAEASKPEPKPADETRLTDLELSIFRSDTFRRQWAESYLAETDIEPRVSDEEIVELQEVQELIAADSLGEAARLLEQYRSDAKSAVYDYLLGNVYMRLERMDDAAAAYEVAVNKYTKFRRAWQNLGVIYARQGDFEKALPTLTRVLELGGGNSTTYGLLGHAYYTQENALAAETAFRTAIMLDPETVNWQTGLARTLFKQNRFADAVALCDSLIAANPENGNLWLLQANAYIGLEKPLEAAENYELVDALGQSTPDSLNNLGDVYVTQKLFDVAADCYVRAMELDRELAPDRAMRAVRVLVAQGATVETRKILGGIGTIHGDDLEMEQRKELLKLMARVAVAEGGGEEEVRVLEEVVELDPLDGEALVLLGEHSMRNGDDVKAIFYFERAAGIEKTEAEAKRKHAQVLVGQGKYKEALPLLRSSQELDPREAVQRYLDQIEQLAQSRVRS